MSKQFTCDRCGQSFPSTIEEVTIKDEHGVWTTYDFCAPCNNLFKEETSGKAFIKKIKKVK